MMTVAKDDLVAKVSEYFRLVESDGEDLVVTSRGVPVFRVVPYQKHGKVRVAEVFGDLRGAVQYSGDLLELGIHFA